MTHVTHVQRKHDQATRNILAMRLGRRRTNPRRLRAWSAARFKWMLKGGCRWHSTSAIIATLS